MMRRMRVRTATKRLSLMLALWKSSLTYSEVIRKKNWSATIRSSFSTKIRCVRIKQSWS